MLGRSEAGVLLAAAVILIAFAFVAVIWPRVLAWPLALIILLFGFNLLAAYLRARNRKGQDAAKVKEAP